MLSIFDIGDGSFRLVDLQDRDVGWIRGSALGFDGLATEADAVTAAVAGAEALAGHLARLTGARRPHELPSGPVRVVHDGAYEWVARGTAPLGRLFRPERDRPRRDRRRSFGLEFLLPSYARPGAAIGAAPVVYRAIAASATTRAGGAPDAPAPARAPHDAVAGLAAS